MLKNKKTGLVIQARTNSTRLPNKVLLPLPYTSDECVLQQILKRAKAVGDIDHIIVATSKNHENDIVEKIALASNVDVYRGSEDDVLERYYESAKMYGLDIIVRLTADNPFIDPQILEEFINESITEEAEYAITKGLPVGCNFEFITYAALEHAFIEAVDARDREHVTLYIRDRASKFKTYIKTFESDKNEQGDWRLTVDTGNDYALACHIYNELYKENTLFGIAEIVSLFHKQPWLPLINGDTMQKRIYKNISEEVKDAIILLKRQELNKAASFLENFLVNQKS